MTNRLLVLGLVSILVLPSAVAETISGRAVGVTDGDTIKVLDTGLELHVVRLAGIDAPEKRQHYGQRSKEHLSGLVYRREVILECGKRDRYKREVCVVFVGGRDANLAQVEAGYAWWYRQYAKEQSASQRLEYERAEDSARNLRKGLWDEASPVAPWDWRHRGEAVR